MADKAPADNYNFPCTNPPDARDGAGYSGSTTPEQDAQLFQLRLLLQEAGCTERLDTITLLRFLRARKQKTLDKAGNVKFDVELSKQMFLKSEEWRKRSDYWDAEHNLAYQVKNFEYKEKPEVFKYYPQYYHKTDKDGRPVYIEALGKIDLTALMKITKEERMLTNLAVEYEKLADPRLPACSRKAGRLLETCCTILDLKGVGLTSIPSTYGYLKKTSVMSQDYYPERLGKLYVINAPWGFSTVFSVVKGFLDPVTVNKIHVLGSGYEKELLAQIPKENLPKQFGGTCECAGGCELSDAGPWQESEFQGSYFKDTGADPGTAETTQTQA